MVLPPLVKRKIAKTRRSKPIDVDKRTFSFSFLEDMSSTEFVVGPLKWRIFCYIGDKTESISKRKTKKGTTTAAVDVNVDNPKRQKPEKKAEPVDLMSEYLHVCLSCPNLAEDMTVTTNGWLQMCPKQDFKLPSLLRDQAKNYRKKMDQDFSTTTFSMNFYNFCSKDVLQNEYTNTDGTFKILLFIRVVRLQVDRCSTFYFRQIGRTIRTPFSDITFTIDSGNKTFTFEVNSQLVSMYSKALAEKIATTQKVGDSYPPINLTGEFQSSEMREFLLFVYPTIRPITNGNVGDILEVADHFDAPSIREVCQRYLVDNFQRFTNFQLLNLANKHNLTQIAALVLRKLDSKSGASDMLTRLESKGAVIDMNLRAAIQRHIDHPTRFKRYFKPNVVERMNVDNAIHRIQNMQLNKKKKESTKLQRKRLDNCKKISALSKLKASQEHVMAAGGANPEAGAPQ